MTARALNAARKHNYNLAKYQEQLVTGLRINRPSDDPIGTRAVLAHRADESRLEAEIGNIQSARLKLNSSVTRLLEAKDMLVTAKTTAQQSASSSEGHILAGQIDQLFDRFLQVTNAQVGDEYLFGGTAVTTKPFQGVTVNGQQTITYHGTEQREHIVVGIGLTVDAIYHGEETFLATDRQPSEFTGSTGAQPGIGTNSGTGRQTLSVTHTNTSYAGTSGIVAGSSSDKGDTILGPAGAHQLEVIDTSGDGSAGTISLNGGPPVAYSNSDTDLRIEGTNGAVVFVDASAISAGFNGVVDITSDGTLQVDDGPAIAIDFTNNQIVTDANGTVTHVDSSQITRAGEDSIQHVGTSTVFDVFNQLSDDLRNAEGLSDVEVEERINDSIGELDRFIDHLLNIVGEQSTSLESLDSIEIRNEDVQLELQRVISDIESADIAEAIINLQTQQNLLQYTYSATSQLFQTSLLNYL
jgi:flagellar hook-associated protein 3